MNLVEVIKKRRSVRIFKERGVDPSLIENLLLIARECPSAGAIRGCRAIITKERVAYIAAPLYAVICANPEAYVKRYGNRGRDLYSIQDATIFGAYLQLLLVNEGLSSVWIGTFKENKVKRIVNTVLRPVAILAIGYAKKVKRAL